MKVLPFHSDSPNYRFRCQLDGVTFIFDVLWNSVSAGWYVTISDSGGVALASGVRITCGLPLFARSKQAALPAGKLMAVNFVTPEITPGYGDLGTNVLVMYLQDGESLT